MSCSGRRADRPWWPRLISLFHLAMRDTSGRMSGLTQVSRGLPRGRLHDGEGGLPERTSMASLRARWAGVLSSSLATWPNREERRELMILAMGGCPVIWRIVSFLTMSNHLMPRMRRWHRMWKASSRRVSAFVSDQVSAPYRQTGMMQVTYIRSFVLRDSFPWDQTRLRLFMEVDAIPIRRRRSDLLVPNESWMIPK
jgi:hypothetical protein